MKTALITALIVVATVAGASLMITRADAKTAAAQDIEKLEAQLAALTEKYELLSTAFERHTHPVMMWNESTRTASSWGRGTYFIAYPKIAAGTDHKAAVRAGGTWGTP